MLNEIANSKYPLKSLVEMALSEKDITPSKDIIEQYSSLLNTSILADEGWDVNSLPWGEYVMAISGKNKFASVVQQLGNTLNASGEEIDQFMAVTDGVSQIMDGEDPDFVTSEISKMLGYSEEDQTNQDTIYSHLDEESRNELLERNSVHQYEDDIEVFDDASDYE